MNSNINYGMKGSYRVDIKNAKREIVESTDWFDNDITNIGLNYPFFYSFARCFMFLSLGSNTTSAYGSRQNFSGFPVNTLTGILVQTGVAPNIGYYYQPTEYIGWQGYELGQPKNNLTSLDSSTCGTTFNNQGMNFYRGWTIPTGLEENPGSQLAQNVTINSLMVSPSSGGDTVGQYAFSIVDRSIIIPSGFSATITYQLSLSLPTYTNTYNFFQSYTGNAPFTYTGFTGNYTGNPNGWFSLTNAATGTNGSETGLLSLWGNLSGIYRQVYPGIEVVNPLGACIFPVNGNFLEPYITQCYNLNFYLSPDMTQFGINKYSLGGPATGEYGAYNSNGLSCNYIEYIGYTGLTPNVSTSDSLNASFPSSPNDYYYSGTSDPASSLLVSQDLSPSLPNNIRLENLLPITNYDNGAINFGVGNTSYATPLFVSAAQNPVAYATPGSGVNSNFTNFGQKAIVSSYLKELPNPNTPTPLSNTGNISLTRMNTVNKKGFFPPIQSLGINSRFGSMTLGWNSSAAPISSATFQPYMDFIFFDTSGRIANMPHYRLIPWIYLKNRGSGVAGAIFSITGNGGVQPTSIQRFWQASSFMGPGNTANSSGLDFNHPMYAMYLTDPLNNQGNPSFNPPYPNNQAPFGYTFAGASLTALDSGYDGNSNAGSIGTYLNNGSGWGAVYGVVATTGFYQSYIDCGLVDAPTWSGYTGTLSGIPDSTGTQLFWPITGNSLGLQISGLQYISNGYFSNGGIFADTGNYIGTSISGTGFQLVQDIYISGTGNLSQLATQNNTLYLITGTTLASLYTGKYGLVSITSPYLNTLLPLTAFSGFNCSGTPVTSLGFYYLTGNDGTNITVTGFYLSGANLIGYQQSMTPSNITHGILTTAQNVLEGVGYAGTFKINPVSTWFPAFFAIQNGGNYYPFTGSNYSLTSTQLYPPSGIIQHFENVNINGYTTGNRLLPNYALPNNHGINTYGATKGGAFPGLSTQNGMEVFLNFTWSG